MKATKGQDIKRRVLRHIECNPYWGLQKTMEKFGLQAIVEKRLPNGINKVAICSGQTKCFDVHLDDEAAVEICAK